MSFARATCEFRAQNAAPAAARFSECAFFSGFFAVTSGIIIRVSGVLFSDLTGGHVHHVHHVHHIRRHTRSRRMRRMALSGFVRVCPVFVHLFPLFFRLFGQMDKVDKLLRVFSEGLADRSVNLSHPYSLIDKSYIDILRYLLDRQ